MEVGPSAAPMMPMDSRVLQVKAHEGGGTDREENTELSGCAEQEHDRLGKQGAEIDHGADADEQQDGHCLRGLDSHIEQPFHNAGYLSDAGHLLVDHAREREIYQNGAEAHRKKQGRLIFLLNGKINEQGADQIHDDLLRGDG